MQAKDDRISAMLLGRRAIRVVPVPGFEPVEGEPTPTVGVRILVESELDEARFDAIQYVEQTARKYRLEPVDMMRLDGEILDRELQRAIVARAYVVPADDVRSEPKRFFESLARVRMLDSVIFDAFFALYLEHQQHVNPYRTLADDEFRELADALKKGRIDPIVLGLYDADSLRRLVRSMVPQQET